MTDDGREIAWLRAALAREGGAPASEGCPPPERIWEAVAGRLDPGETRDLVDHVATCAACAEEWRLAVELGAGEERPAGAAGRGARPPWRTWLPLAASLSAVALGIGFFEWREGGGDRPAEGRRPVVRGEVGEIRPLVADGAHLDRDRFVLRWTLPEGARSCSYTVLVQDAAGRPLARQEKLTAPQAEVPASAFAGLEASQPVFWMVTATCSGSGTRTSSQAWKVLLR